MTDYISRERLLHEIRWQHSDDALHYPSWYEEMVKKQPAVDVRPVVHGKWILQDNGSANCSVCKCWQKLIYDDDSYQHYCGNCGAQMEVKE